MNTYRNFNGKQYKRGIAVYGTKREVLEMKKDYKKNNVNAIVGKCKDGYFLWWKRGKDKKAPDTITRNGVNLRKKLTSNVPGAKLLEKSRKRFQKSGHYTSIRKVQGKYVLYVAKKKQK